MTESYRIDLGNFEISTDRARLNLDRIEAFLGDSYWVVGRPRDVIERSIENSLCFGVYRKDDGLLVGFARVVTDYSTFSWLAGVYVDPAQRGAGLGRALVHAVVAHPALAGVRMALTTRDAHGLYAQFGFEALPHSERWMLRADS